MTAPQPRPGILDIKPYVPGASSAPGAARIFKLSSNESALGASPKAISAYNDAAGDLFSYPDGGSTALRDKIAEVYGLDASRIVCGAGSDEILQLLTKAYVGAGDNIVQSEHGFLVYALAAMSCGAEPRFAKETNFTTDIDAMLGLVDDRTRMMFVANPNNPTGSYITEAELLCLRQGLRDDILLVIDAAYAEFMEQSDYNGGERLVDRFDNVVMTRTFSKIYGLAALRLGWGYCPPAVADVLNRIRGPFNVTLPAQAAGLAALDDQDFVDKNRAFTCEQREWMAGRLAAMGLEFAPSFGNFILVKFPSTAGLNAKDMKAFLRSEGVIVREMGAYKLSDYLRVSIGDKDANQKFIELLARKFPSR